MKKIYSIFVLAFVSLVLAMPAFSNVGIGVSPSRIILQADAGSTQEIELLVFNTGDTPLDATISFEGDIAQFSTSSPEKYTIQPEPVPHALPIKNGVTYIVKIKLPNEAGKTYKGTIAATGSLVSGSQFGGSVGVATQIEITTSPAKSFTIDTIYLIAIAIIIALIIIILLVKKSGISFKVERKVAVTKSEK